MAYYVSQCCGCCSLRTGALIISIFLSVSAILTLVYLGTAVQVIKYDIDTQDTETITLSPNSKYMVNGPYALSILYTAIASLTISLFFNLTLLIGSLKEVPVLILAWVVYASIGVVIEIIGGIFNVVCAVGIDTAVLTLLLTFLIISIQVYMIIVVKSYWQEVTQMRNVMRTSNQIFASDTMKQPDLFPCHPPPYTYDNTVQSTTIHE
jgi:hypothetical protein